MKNEWLNHSPGVQIQGLLDQYLRSQVSGEELTKQAEHLDDDSLTAFVEGNLAERENKSILGHLVECSFCRHVTTELIKLDLAFAEEEIHIVADNQQPSRISEVLSTLLARIFGSNDEAVFAHQEKKENETETENSTDSEK